jgi:hypothetical protein
MTNLKTLKDFENLWLYTGHEKEVFRLVREEAIKWVKWSKQEEKEFGIDITWFLSSWETFFNITEDDLK